MNNITRHRDLIEKISLKDYGETQHMEEEFRHAIDNAANLIDKHIDELEDIANNYDLSDQEILAYKNKFKKFSIWENLDT